MFRYQYWYLWSLPWRINQQGSPKLRITAYMYTVLLSRSRVHVIFRCLLESVWCTRTWNANMTVFSRCGFVVEAFPLLVLMTVTHMQVSYIPLLISSYAFDHLLATRRVMLRYNEYNSHLSKHHCLHVGLQESFMLCGLQTHGLFKLVDREHHN